MQLNNLTILDERSPVTLMVSGEKIRSIGTGRFREDGDYFQIRFTDALVLPGLINSHDHLDFNCFTVFGERKYKNYTDWGRHIHESYKEKINEVLKIPKDLRASWGMYKNLLAGVTTVVNHGAHLEIENPLINIYQEPQNLHSVEFEKNWKWKLNNPLFKNKDCVIHTGEGSDEQSVREINELLRFNLLKRKLVGVHGVAMNPVQARHFKGLVWCPESNRVLLDKHAGINQLKEYTRVVFGTDSTLTGSWNIWQHLRLARSLNQVSDAELFGMVTHSAARLWNLNSGMLKADTEADLIVVRKKNKIPTWNDVYETDPEDILLVMHKGNIRMFDKSIQPQLIGLPGGLSRFSRIRMNGIVKFVEGDLPSLMSACYTNG